MKYQSFLFSLPWLLPLQSTFGEIFDPLDFNQLVAQEELAMEAVSSMTLGQVIVNGFDTNGRGDTERMHLVSQIFFGSYGRKGSVERCPNELATGEGIAIGQ